MKLLRERAKARMADFEKSGLFGTQQYGKVLLGAWTWIGFMTLAAVTGLVISTPGSHPVEFACCLFVLALCFFLAALFVRSTRLHLRERRRLRGH